jgi:hypothetical protein
VRVMRDLVHPRWLYLKAVLLLIILLSCCVLLLLEVPTWRAALLLSLVVWASARLYYFVFYVIERYIDPSYRFSGIGSALRYFLRRSANRRPPGPGDT